MTIETKSADVSGQSIAKPSGKTEVTPEAKPAVKPGLLSLMQSAFIRWVGAEAGSSEGKSSDELAKDRTLMAADRTLMAADRTLMAWLRTSLSMLTFGFTLYKVLQAFQDAGGLLPKTDTPQNAGLFLTGMGTFAIVIGTVEYWGTIRKLRQFIPIRLVRPPLIMAAVMSVTGVSLFFIIITRLF